MNNNAKTYSIEKIEGDVLIYHELFGWVRAREGMELAANARITIKTGKNGMAVIVNAEGHRLEVPPRSLRLVYGSFTEAEIETLRFVKVNARDMKAARTWERLAPAV
jgi:hypothetical protein